VGTAIIAIIVVVAAIALFALHAKKQRVVGAGAPGQVLGRGPATNRAPAKNRAASAPKPRNPYRCTSIVAGDGACAAVKAIGNTRFLQVERKVPTLPLPTCDAAQCNCKYAHHEDRRESQDDRRHPAALQTELYDKSGNQNRRDRKRGRRKTDWA